MQEDIKNSFLGITNQVPNFEDPIEENTDNPIDITEPPVVEETEVSTEEPTEPTEESSTEDNNVVTQDTEVDEDDGNYSYKALLSHLSEEGLVEFEDSEDLKDSPDLIYESIQKTINNGINQYKESIPEVGRQFLDYLEKGGDPNKYISSLSKPFDPNNVDLTKEVDQEKVVKEYLKELNYSDEEIADTIQDYKDALILEKQAGLYSNKLNKIYEEKTKKLLEEQEIERQNQINNYNKYIEDINTKIETSESIAGLSINKAEKESFRKYLLAVDKDGLTQYQRDIQSNPTQVQLELAYLKFKNYDFSKAIKEGERKAINNLKNVFKNNETTVNAGRASTTRDDEDNNLAAFSWFKHKK